MPEYREIRSKTAGFLDLCQNPELACKVTLLPIDKYNFDAAILFSDILLIPHVMGLGLEFVAQEGPVFAKTIQTEQDVNNLAHIDPNTQLAYVNKAISYIVKELDNKTPLIGFAGSPWTLAAYMVEGQTSKHFYKLKALMYANPKVMHKLLNHMAIQVIASLQAQIDAGVSAVMIFDSWGGVLNDICFKEFSLAYMAQIVHQIQSKNPHIPVILFSKNGGRCLPQIVATGCNAVGVDWTISLSEAKAQIGTKTALQGNLDPCVLYASPKKIEEEVLRVLTEYGPGPGHIFNLGHGIPFDIAPDNVHVLVQAVRKFSPAFHEKLITV